MNSSHQKRTVTESNDGTNNLGIMQQENYQGPIPHPDLFKKFEDTLPGAAERILSMSEKEQDNRHLIDKNKADLDKTSLSLIKTGLYLGFAIVVLCIIGGMILIFNNKSVSGIAIIITALASLIATFMLKK